MPVRLEFVGRDIIRRDPMTFLDQLRAKYPTLNERGLHEVAGRRTCIGSSACVPVVGGRGQCPCQKHSAHCVVA